MKSVPVHLLPRSDAGRQRTLTKFQPKNTIQLRFIDADKAAYYGACHHVDMNVELKSEDGQKTIESLNPFAFQHAVKSISCTTEESDGTVKTSSKDHHQHHLHIELDSQYADQARRWRLSAKNVFAIVIPHDFVDLKNNKACFEDLSPKAKSWVRDHPLETVVKLVKTPQFLDPQRPHRLTLTVVKTDIWSEMNREQSVKIAHRPLDEMIGLIFHKKRSTAEEDGPMWDFEHGLSGATENVSGEMNANNVNADLDQSSVKGYGK
ncbi:hypothetical protein EDD11_008432 [Mortierella claussenii]|nr:hypothetical protein EDD11_008432 [Mortierella claussenii]